MAHKERNMTTIAWDGKILAGDTLAVNGSFCRECVKLHKIDMNTFIGVSGYLEDAYRAVSWLRNPGEDKPELDADTFAAIIVKKGKAFRLESNLIEMPIKESAHAVGSGADCAMVAMYLGKSAIEAVKIAAIFDINTGSKVTSMPVLSVSNPEDS
ncbi:MAG: hypothetical protein ACHQWH_03840 [Nitrososphaerales archaeon]